MATAEGRLPPRLARLFGMEDGTVTSALCSTSPRQQAIGLRILVAGASGRVAAAVSMMAGDLDVETNRDQARCGKHHRCQFTKTAARP